MAEIKKLQVDGADIYPVTHESAVYDNEGKSIESKYLSSVAYTQGDDIKIADGDENIIDTSELEAQIEEVDSKVGELSNLSTSDKDNIVDAINELFQSANNGKELIADAIGEPLDASDTFSAMSNDINGLLSTFKTNMMNNGVTVESGDKFKSLIDKVATMVEDGGGKGIQYAEGNLGEVIVKEGGSFRKNTIYYENIGIDFVPTLLIVNMNEIPSYEGSSSSVNYTIVNSAINNSQTTSALYNGSHGCYINNLTDESFDIYIQFIFNLSYNDVVFDKMTYHAIGVGEEDTTLRDSLANILQDSGVDVTEEDDMASLITKVDEEFDNSLKHASGTYTPTSNVKSVSVPINLSFTPTYFVVNITGIGAGSSSYFSSAVNSDSVVLSTDCPNSKWYLAYTDEAGWQQQGILTLTYNANNFSISGGDTTYRYFDTSTVFTWHAFG